jgi:hypothetical protein
MSVCYTTSSWAENNFGLQKIFANQREKTLKLNLSVGHQKQLLHFIILQALAQVCFFAVVMALQWKEIKHGI